MAKKLWTILLFLEIALVMSCSNEPRSLESSTSAEEYHEINMAIQGNITQEWINLEGFSPDSSVTVEIYESEGEKLSTEPFTVPTDGNGNGSCDGFQFKLNLKPGMHIITSDDSNKILRELTLEDITIDVFDIDMDIVAGTAPPLADLLIRVHDEVLDDGYEMEVIADPDGNWLADFIKEMGADLNENMNPQVLMFDEDGDATIAELTRYPYVEGNLPLDWIATKFFSPDATVTIEIYESEGGSLIGEPIIEDTNWNGEATFEGSEVGIDLQPGMVLVVRDNIDSEVEKTLLLVDLAIDEPDFETNELKGFGPPETWLTFELYDHVDGGEYFADVMSDSDGLWNLNFFEEFGEPVPDSDSTHIKLYDEDGDASVADPL